MGSAKVSAGAITCNSREETIQGNALRTQTHLHLFHKTLMTNIYILPDIGKVSIAAVLDYCASNLAFK